MRYLEIRDLGRDVDYAEVVALQESLLSDRIGGRVPDTLLLLEHRPVFTLGRSGGAGHICWTDAELAQHGISRHQTTRGGDVTYHGPGQLVGYPVIHLGEAGLKLLDYVQALEAVLIRVLAVWGIAGQRDARNHGVWIGNDKIAALGLRISRQVSMHGFALNVNTRLEDYQGIVACGLQDAGVTSLARVTGREQDMAEVKAVVTREFCAEFGYAGGAERTARTAECRTRNADC
ncbi:MAG: lipoyl(octanoyl) transferase LipB [Kiritimatiellia bacterium]